MYYIVASYYVKGLIVKSSTQLTIVTIFTFFTHFLLSSKHPNTRSNHDMALSFLILSYPFTLQSHTIKTRKTDSIGIPT